MKNWIASLLMMMAMPVWADAIDRMIESLSTTQSISADFTQTLQGAAGAQCLG